jgi:two-component system, response regulator YesN
MTAFKKHKLFQFIKQSRPNKLFFHILSYFLAMVLLTAVIGIFFNMLFYKTRQAEYEEKELQSQYSSVALCSSYIRPAMELNLNTLNHFLLKQYLRPFSTATIEQRLKLSAVPVIINSNKTLAGDIVDELFIYNDTKNVFTLNGIDDFKLYLKKYYGYSNIEITFFEQLLKSTTGFQALKPTETFRYYQNQSCTVLPLISSEYINGYNTIAVTNINLSQVTNLLKNSTAFTDTKFLLLNEKNEMLISSDDHFTQDGQSIIATQQQTLLKNGSVYGSADKISYFVSYVPFGDYGWQYYCFTPIKHLIQVNNQIIPNTVLTCILLVILGIFLSFGFTYTIYNPILNIRSIIERNMSQDKGNPHSLSRLIRSESNIDVLVNRYHEILNSKKIGFESTILTAVIENKIPCSKEDFVLLLEKNCNFYEPYFSCNVIKFVFNDVFYEEMDEAIQETVCQALNVLINEYTKILCNSYTFELGDGVFINLMNLKTPDCCTSIVSTFTELLNVFNYDNLYYTVSIGLGKIKKDPAEIPGSYDDAMTAIEYLCNNSIQLGNACEMKISHTIHYSLMTEKKIISLFEKGDLISLRNIINELISEHAASLLSWRCMHSLIKRIYYSASFQLDNAPNLFDEVQISCTLEEKVSMLLTAYDKIMAANEVNASGEKVLISAIRQYIDAHFSEDISLHVLSGKMGYNYKYISRIFKEYTGYNISDYINFVRIEKAKELIENSTMNMEEIQNVIGIPSRTTFNRVFKKHEGIPPGKYRQLKAHNRILALIEDKPLDTTDGGTC